MFDKKEMSCSIEKIAKNAGQMMMNRENIEINEKTDIANIVTDRDVKIQK